MTWVLIPVAIAINIVISQIVLVLRLPVFLDSIGTVLVAAVAGPWAGALTGTLSNITRGLLINPHSFPWFPVAMMIGFVVGWCAIGGLFKSWWKVMITGFLVAITVALVSTPITVYLYGGIAHSGTAFITAFLLQTGRDLVPAVLSTNFLVEPFDKVATCLLAFAVIEGLSVRYLARFPRPENVEIDKAQRNTQIIISIIVAVILILVYAYIVVRLLGL